MKVYIGIDAHSTNYTLSSYNSEADDCTNAVTLKPEYEGIVKYAKKIKEMHGPNTAVLCGYEAGCLGYTLYKQLTDAGVACVIMAPSTIATVQHNKKHGKKTDKRDACSIAKALAYGLRPANPDVPVDATEESLFVKWKDQGVQTVVPRTTAMRSPDRDVLLALLRWFDLNVAQ